MIQTVLRQYAILGILSSSSIAFTAACYTSILETIGLNIWQRNVVNVAFYVTITLFEIPTGIFADVYGRKKSLLVSSVIVACGLFVYTQATSLSICIVAESIIAIGITFSSGAMRAWFVDRLKFYEFDTNQLVRVFATNRAWCALAGIVAANCGAMMWQEYTYLPWMLGCLTSLASGVYVLHIDEEYWKSRQKKDIDLGLWRVLEIMKSVFVQSLRLVMEQTELRKLMCLGALLMCCVQTVNMQWQQYFAKALDPRYFGLLWILVPVSVFTSLHFVRSHRTIQSTRTLCLVLSFVGLSMILMVFGMRIFGLWGLITTFGFHQLLRGLINPLKDSLLEERFESSVRATLGSVDSLVTHAGGVLGLVSSGLIAYLFGLEASWLFFGFVLTITMTVFCRFGR